MRRALLLSIPALFALCMGNACDDVVEGSEALCGPCGSVADGDDFISGDARVDGMFKAIGTIGAATSQIEADLEAELVALAEAFDVEVEAGVSLEDLAAAVRTEIDAEIAANVSGGLEVDFVAPKCEAAVEVAVEAQASCEAQAGCEVSAECESGEVAVSCSGSCSGGCSGECSGGCVMEASGICEGTCTGSCELEVGGTCEGICRGECSGTCSMYSNGPGGGLQCEGECDGECSGSCELKAGGECSGECHGECEVEVTAECSGECHGTCSGSCSGGCEGEVTPPSCSAEGSCDVTADCQASASAQGSASLECTPPTLNLRYDFKAELENDLEAQAKFVAKMAALKVHMMGIVQGMYRMRALVDPDYAASLGIDPPLVMIAGQFEVLLTADLDSFDIPPGKLPCVLPALEESVDILTDMSTELAGVFQAQFEIVSVLEII